jgi:hypothetical protein
VRLKSTGQLAPDLFFEEIGTGRWVRSFLVATPLSLHVRSPSRTQARPIAMMVGLSLAADIRGTRGRR